MKHINVLFCATLLLVTSAFPVQAETLEATLFISTRIGGDIDGLDSDQGVTDFEVDAGGGFGGSVSVPIHPRLRLEFFLSHQNTELEARSGFLEPASEVYDITIDYYHVGLSWDFDLDHITPYVGAGIGATVFDTKSDALDDTSRFSINLNGGIKYALADSLAIRLESRFYSTYIDDDDRIYCDRFRCYPHSRGESMEQLELSVGLAFRY